MNDFPFRYWSQKTGKSAILWIDLTKLPAFRTVIEALKSEGLAKNGNEDNPNAITSITVAGEDRLLKELGFDAEHRTDDDRGMDWL